MKHREWTGNIMNGISAHIETSFFSYIYGNCSACDVNRGPFLLLSDLTNLQIFMQKAS